MSIIRDAIMIVAAFLVGFGLVAACVPREGARQICEGIDNDALVRHMPTQLFGVIGWPRLYKEGAAFYPINKAMRSIETPCHDLESMQHIRRQVLEGTGSLSN